MTEWRTVPVEPTPEMRAAGWELYDAYKRGELNGSPTLAIYRAMLAASPPAPQSDADVEGIAGEIVDKWPLDGGTAGKPPPAKSSLIESDRPSEG